MGWLLACVALAGCGGPQTRDCRPTDTLVDLSGQIVVMTDSCGDGTIRTRPAEPADLARLEAPL